MGRSAALVIASIATLVVLIQNVMSVTAFGWAAIHGAGASALLAFLPAAIGLAVLWTGYFVMTRSTVRRLMPDFSIYATGASLTRRGLTGSSISNSKRR